MNGYDEIAKQMPEKNKYGEYIVRIAQRYNFERDYEEFNTCVDFGFENVTWMSDWWEGQEHVILKGYIRVEDVEGLINA